MSSAATKRKPEDRKDREAIVAALDAQLKKGDKAFDRQFRLSSALCAESGQRRHSLQIDAGKLRRGGALRRDFRLAHPTRR